MRPSIRSQGRVQSSRLDTRLDTHDEYPTMDSPTRPNFGRSSTFQGPTSIYRETTPVNGMRKVSNPNEREVGTVRASLRPTNRINTGDVFGDPSDESTLNSGSPDHSLGERSVSPATSHSSYSSRTATLNSAGGGNNGGRKGPPPPPPNRAKKPPPPPPMKRADMSSTSVGRY